MHHNRMEERSPANSSSAYSTGRSISGDDTHDQSVPLILYREIRKTGRGRRPAGPGTRAVVQQVPSSSSRRRQSAEMKISAAKNQEQMALVQNGDADDGSDLESNVSRLCQYLSSSEIEEDDIGIGHNTASIPRFKSGPRKVVIPKGYHSSTHKNRPESYTEGSTTGSSAEDCARNGIVIMNESTELHSMASASTSSYHRRAGKPTIPTDFLSCIPPPSHPPEASPTFDVDVRRSSPRTLSPDVNRPLPPNRQLPPVPSPPMEQPMKDDDHYDEARPPPPAPRPSKMKNQMMSPPPDGYELSASRIALLNHSAVTHHTPQHHQQRLAAQFDPTVNDWDFQPTLLEKNPETGSFYIPSGSGHTTMSSLSPQSRSNGLSHHDRNYTQLPSERTTVPVSVMASTTGYPEQTGSATYLKRNGTTLAAPVMPRKQAPSRNAPSHYDKGRCSYKTCALILAILLIIASVVIGYLLVKPGNTRRDTVTYYPGTSMYGNQGAPGEPSQVEPINLRPLPDTFDLGDPFVADLPPGILAYSSFTLQRSSHVQFNISIAPDAKLVIYGQQTVNPTPTEHKFTRIILGRNLHMKEGRKKRSLAGYGLNEKNLLSTSFVEYLSSGRWHLGFFNDDSDVQTVRFKAYPVHDQLQLAGCRYDCYGKGECRDGMCYCQPGYSGEYCQETTCPVLCSGNGILSGGRCHCHQGWKGPDCDIPGHVCLVPNCNGHGSCDPQGVCNCDAGWMGEFCEQKSCPHEHCSGHGVCHVGVCYCEFGWKGDRCDQAFTSEELCPLGSGEDSSRLQCSAHGQWDSMTAQCSCDQGYTGRYCDQESCPPNCLHGTCINGRCMCDAGWSGQECDVVTCLPGCEDHGQCIDGVCHCHKGYYGQNCQLDGCPNLCNSRGECRKQNDRYFCVCSSDATGHACQIPRELTCDDNIDNDKDNLTDCDDSECCLHAVCASTQICTTVADPYDVLVRAQSIPAHTDFYVKTRFLVQPESVQQYPDNTLFEKRRASVIRGRVVTSNGGYLTGVRVTDASNPLFGFTISRGGGVFDLMVNGGGSVTLQLMRRPQGTVRKTVQVPCNRIVYVGDIIMNSTYQEPKLSSEACMSARKQHRLIPFLLPSWKASQFAGPIGLPGGSILADSRSVYQTLDIPGTDGLYLTYHSSHFEGYRSSLWMTLVPEKMPFDLRLVELEVDIEGVRFSTTLEAKPNLTYEYGWDKKNVYKQKVFGLTAAMVSVGYVYKDCSLPIWERKEVKLNGFKSGAHTVANWNLNIHHHLDVIGGVLEKGDGSTVYMSEGAMLVKTTVGRWGAHSSMQRPLQCPMCNGDADRASLYHPMALSASRDGSLYIGDFDLIRKLAPNRTITTVLELSPADTTVTHPYHLASHAISGQLYISLPLRRQIWVATKSTQDSTYSTRVIAGDGLPCRVGDSTNCGEGGPADMAHLSYPKGMAFDASGVLYVLDERRVVTVDGEGTLRTVVGKTDGKDTEPWTPSLCQQQQSLHNFTLFWPTHIAVDPLSQKILVLDADVVYRIDLQASIVERILGTPSHCPASSTARTTVLESAKSLAVDGQGRVIIAESDGRRLHRVRAFQMAQGVGSQSPTLTPIPDFVVGAQSKCDCDRTNCPCDDRDVLYARDARLHNPSAVAVDVDGHVHIADTANYKIKTLVPNMPHKHGHNAQLHVVDPDHQQKYYFNRYGQHIATKNLLSDKFVYNFTFNIDTQFGKLIHVTAAGGHRLYFLRKGPSLVVIETAQKQKTQLEISNFQGQQLDAVTGPDAGKTMFSYDQTVGLLTARINPDYRTWQYNYDYDGHVKHSIDPTGVNSSIEVTATDKGITAKVSVDGEQQRVITAAEGESSMTGLVERTMYTFSDGRTVHVESADGSKVQFDSFTNSLLQPHQTAVLRQKVLLPSTDSDASADGLTSKLEWRYYLRREGGSRQHKRVVQVGRKTRVNGVNVLTIEYDRNANKDTIFDQAGNNILSVQYNLAGEILSMTPSSASDLSAYNATYDSVGRLKVTSWGMSHKAYKYDEESRITAILNGRRHIECTYAEQGQKLPSTVKYAGGSQYRNVWDSEGRLMEIVTPENLRYTYSTLQEFGYTMALYALPHMNKDQSPLAVGYDASEQVTLVVLPDSYRRVSIDRDSASKPVSIAHDGRLTLLHYYDGTHQLRTVTSKSCENDVWSRSITRNGGLPVEVYETRHPSASQPCGAHFRVNYDDIVRMTSLQASFNSEKTLQPISFEYDRHSGRLSKYGDFNIQYSGAKVRMLNHKAVLEMVSNERRKISSIKLSLRGRKCSEILFTYNAWDEVTEISTTVLSEEQPSTTALFNDDGLMELYKVKDTVESEREWKIQYSVDGRVHMINDKQILYQHAIVKSFGELEYVTDASGFVLKRGVEYFEYDSFGRMVSARQEGVYTKSYVYDEMHRLITILPSDGIAINLFYAHPGKSNLLTHSVRGDSVTVYHYDTQDKIFAVEQDSTLYFVARIFDGTPAYVFTEDGTLTKSMLFGPFGEKVRDTKLDLNILIGWKGYIQDADTGVVFMDGRPFDSVIGRFMSIRPADWTPVQPANPRTADPFMWSQRKETHERIDIVDWLEHVGVRMDDLVPLLSSTSTSSRLCASSTVNVGAECHFRNRNRQFHKFLTVTNSGFVPNALASHKVHFTPSPSVFGGRGAVLSNVSDIAVLNLGRPEIQRMNLEEGIVILLNESQILSIVALGRARVVTHMFCKFGTADDDLNPLAITVDYDRHVQLSNSLNMSVSAVDNVDMQYIDIWSDYAATRIFYVQNSDCAKAMNYARKELIEQTRTDFWKWENWKSRALLPSEKSLTDLQEDLIENEERDSLVEICEGQSPFDPTALRAIQR